MLQAHLQADTSACVKSRNAVQLPGGHKDALSQTELPSPLCRNDSPAVWSGATSHGLGFESAITGNGLPPPSQDDFFSFSLVCVLLFSEPPHFRPLWCIESQRRDGGPSALSLIGWSHRGAGQFFLTWRRCGSFVRLLGASWSAATADLLCLQPRHPPRCRASVSSWLCLCWMLSTRTASLSQVTNV